MIRTRWLGALLFGLLLTAPGVAAQNSSAPDTRRLDFEVHDTELASALGLLADRGIDLIWESLEFTTRRVDCTLRNAPVDRILDCILEGSGLEARRLPSGAWSISPPPGEPGILVGVVVDAGSGRPIPWAEVELPTGDRTTTNASGIFLLSGVRPGRNEVVASRIGYRPTTTPVAVAAGTTSRATLPLIPAAVQLSPVVVRGIESPPGTTSDGARFALDDAGELNAIASGVGGAAAGATGVRSAPFAGDLLVQGSESGQNPVLLDGVPIFEPLSIGRSRGAFSPLALEEIRVRKAGFPASGGSYIAGALELDHAYSVGPEDTGVTGSVDPFAVNLRLALPFRRGDGASGPRSGGIMAAGRFGLWELYREPTLNRTIRDWSLVDPILTRQAIGDGRFFTDGLIFDRQGSSSSFGFSDLHLAARLPVGDFSRIEASFYRGDNQVDSELFTSGARPSDRRIQRLLLTRDDYQWENLGGQLSLHGLAGQRGAFRVRARASLHSLDHVYEFAEGSDIEYPDGEPEPVIAVLERELRDQLDATQPAADANRIAEYAVEGRLDWAAGAGHRLLGGLEVVRVESNVFISDPNLIPLVSRIGHWRYSAFLEDRWTISPGLRVEGGVRATRISSHGDLWVEPRLALEASGASIGGWRLRAATGVYRQYVNRFELSTLGPSALVPELTFWLPTDASVSPPRSRHAALEASIAPLKGWEFQAEVWYKSLDRILDLDYTTFLTGSGSGLDEVAQDVFVADADGRAWGAGIRATRRVRGGSLRIGYERSASDRTFPGRFSGLRQPIPSNLPHLLFGGIDREIGGGFGWRMEGRAAWDRSWGLRRAYYDYVTLEGEDLGPVIGVPRDDALPAQIDLDLGVRWAGRLSGARIEAQLMITNVLDRANVLDRSLRRDADATSDGSGESSSWHTVDRLLPGLTPVLTVRIGPF